MDDNPTGAILQRDEKTYAIVPRTPVGLVTPEHLENIAAVARKFDIPVIKITSGQRFALVGIKRDDVDEVWRELGMGFWHLPLWVATSLGGTELVVYIAAFMLAIISLSIVITVWYGLCPNLLVAGVLHLGFNFWFNFAAVDVNAFLIGLALAYALAASVLAIVNPKRTLRA